MASRIENKAVSKARKSLHKEQGRNYAKTVDAKWLKKPSKASGRQAEDAKQGLVELAEMRAMAFNIREEVVALELVMSAPGAENLSKEEIIEKTTSDLVGLGHYLPGEALAKMVTEAYDQKKEQKESHETLPEAPQVSREDFTFSDAAEIFEPAKAEKTENNPGWCLPRFLRQAVAIGFLAVNVSGCAAMIGNTQEVSYVPNQTYTMTAPEISDRQLHSMHTSRDTNTVAGVRDQLFQDLNTNLVDYVLVLATDPTTGKAGLRKSDLSPRLKSAQATIKSILGFGGDVRGDVQAFNSIMDSDSLSKLDRRLYERLNQAYHVNSRATLRTDRINESLGRYLMKLSDWYRSSEHLNAHGIRYITKSGRLVEEHNTRAATSITQFQQLEIEKANLLANVSIAVRSTDAENHNEHSARAYSCLAHIIKMKRDFAISEMRLRATRLKMSSNNTSGPEWKQALDFELAASAMQKEVTAQRTAAGDINRTNALAR